MIDIQPLKDLAAECSLVVDTLNQLKHLKPWTEADGAQDLEKWHREFHQIFRTLSTLPDPTRVVTFGEELAAVLARIAGTDAPPEPPKEEALLPEEPTLFRVKVTKDGGVAGDENNNCTWTYTVTSVYDVELGTAITPEKARYPKCTYDQPGAATPGLAYWHTDNTIKLYEALEEIPDTNVC